MTESPLVPGRSGPVRAGPGRGPGRSGPHARPGPEPEPDRWWDGRTEQIVMRLTVHGDAPEGAGAVFLAAAVVLVWCCGSDGTGRW
ncbi:hypothetical protein [Streptomyces sp. NPDC058092]|uniref:hypothetical protein n=1 Tax=Streptomyces sp. NPDC058092 TaxID=3346336 RepID=UPI0036EC67D9